MAFEGQQPVKVIGAVTGGDLSASTVYGKFVKFNGTGSQVVVCTAITDVPCGVVTGLPATSDTGIPIEVTALGQVKVQIDGSTVTAAGQLIGTTNAGQAVKLTPGTDTTAYIAGQVVALGGATTAAALVDAMINCVSPARAA